MAEMGARDIVVMMMGDHEARAFETLSQLAEMARATSLGLTLEFIAASQRPSLAAAVDLVMRIGQDNIGVRIDLLHLAQSGEIPSDVAALPPANLDFERYERAARLSRLALGAGDLPVREFLAALPADLTVGIEVPNPHAPERKSYTKMLLEQARRFDK